MLLIFTKKEAQPYELSLSVVKNVEHVSRVKANIT